MLHEAHDRLATILEEQRANLSATPEHEKDLIEALEEIVENLEETVSSIDDALSTLEGSDFWFLNQPIGLLI